MFAIAFMGVIMHELTVGQVQAVVAAMKMAAGNDSLLACNASGVFVSAPRLAEQLEMLFDSGIDIIFAGEQAIARNSGRSELCARSGSLLRPMNIGGSAPGSGTKLQDCGSEKIWMLCLTDQSYRVPVEPADEILEAFLRNKNDDFPVFINMNGKDCDFKKGLAWRFRSTGCSVTIIGSGLSFASSHTLIDANGNLFVADSGIVSSQDSIAGTAPEIWWKRSVEKIPVAAMPGNGRLEVDFSVVFYANKKVARVEQHRQVI